MLVVVMVEVIRSPGYSPLDAVWFLAHDCWSAWSPASWSEVWRRSRCGG
ncbi:MAG TPA: hypothetical protein VIJ60_06290 [Acidimicrobiales bacterium]